MIGATRVGRYRVLRLIRRGGQGEVYLGYDDRLRREVTIKRYRLPARRQVRSRVLGEARIIAAIDSPRVVRIHDVVNTRRHLALITQYVPGRDLEELMRLGPLALREILSIAVDLCTALAVVHRHRLVHGDIKAANVLVNATGRGLLIDFGIARCFDGHGGYALRAGSPAAMTPELLRGEPLDCRADLFALGCLLYRMLAGRHPFMESGELLTARLLEGLPPPLPATLADGTPIPFGLRGLVAGLLHTSPDRRVASAGAVRASLLRLARGGGP